MATKRPALALPKRFNVNQEKRTLTLKIEFASVTGKESDQDFKDFKSQIENLIRTFKPKSKSKWTLREKNETRRG